MPEEFGGLLVVGEAPGAQEVLAGKPFIGQSGKLLRILLEKAGFDPNKVYYTNACLCRPPSNDTPSKEDVAACNGRLWSEIDTIRPRMIIALGDTALKALVVKAPTIGKVRGTFHSVEGYEVMATWHPAYALRNGNAVQDILGDLQRVKESMDKGSVQRFQTPTYKVVDRLPERDGSPLVFVDFETTNVLHPWQGRIYLTGIMFDDDPVVYIMQGPTPNLLPNYRYVAHNAMFEYKWIKCKLGFTPHIEADTLLMHYCIKEVPPHDLKSIGIEYLNLQESWSIDASKITTYPIEEAMQYLAWDVAVTRELYHIFNQSARVREVHYPLLMKGLPMLTDMHIKGMPIDFDFLHDVELKLDDQITKLTQQFHELSGSTINVRSNKALGHLLYNELGLPRINGMSTAEECLIALNGKHPCITPLLDIRKLEKLRGTYVVGLQKAAAFDDLVHTTFNQAVATTGRLSSSQPVNLQNMPRPDDPNKKEEDRRPNIRQAFIAPPGHLFVDADYAQLEWRVAAHESGDENMIQDILDGLDVHRKMASVIFQKPEVEISKAERHWAKNQVVFASLYLKSPKSLFEEFGHIMNFTIADVEHWFDVLFGRYPKLKKWLEDTCLFAVGAPGVGIPAQHYVKHSNGRVRRFPLITNENRNEIKRQAVNSPIQGFASDICYTTAIKLHENYPDDLIDVRLLVHDSICCFVPIGRAKEAVEIITHEMKNPIYQLQVPLAVEVKVSDRWEGTPIDWNGEQEGA